MADDDIDKIGQATEHITEEETVFYNVLPPQNASGPLANAGAAGASNGAALSRAPLVSNTTTGSFLSRINKRLLIIAIGAVVVLGVAGFFVYRLLNKPAAAPAITQPQADQTQNSTPPKQPAGVTTPAEWQKRYFGNEVCQNTTICGDDADPDRDGLTNLEEYKAGTDPNNPDSSGGGLADGDKVHIFGMDPLKVKTKDGQYTDADYAKYGYDITTGQLYTTDKLAAIKAEIKTFGLHQPTITTLGEAGLKLYDFTNPDQSQQTDTNALAGFDQSASSKLDRDTQRSDTIKKAGGALIKYMQAKKSYPDTTTFNDMVTAIRPYVTVATNFSDPVNKGQYVYGYVPGNKAQNFALSYYSETQNQLIKYTDQQAQADAAKDASNAFDDQRSRDLDNLRTALLLYSSHNVDAHSNQQFVFPPVDKYKAALLDGNYISQIPKDPKTNQDYPYQVSDKFDTFTLKATLDNPPAGTTGIVCNQDECKNY